MILVFTSTLSVIPINTADSDLGISEGIAYAWFITKYEEKTVDQFRRTEGFPHPTSDLDVGKGDDFRWEIRGIEERESFFALDYAVCRRVSPTARESTDCFPGYEAKIAKDPMEVAMEWSGKGVKSSYTLVVTPSDAEQYLEGFVEGLPPSNRTLFSAGERTLIYDHDTPEGHYEVIMEYTGWGLQANFSASLDGDLFYRHVYAGTHESTEVPRIRAFFGFLVIAGFLILAIIGAYIQGKKGEEEEGEEKRATITYVEQVMRNQSRSEADIPEYCPKCGVRSQSGANFCEACGERMRCSRCAAKLQLDGNYCEECGRWLQNK
mgnify:CR=1 FL=1